MGGTIFVSRINTDPDSSCTITSDCPPGLYCLIGKCKCKEGTSCNSSSDCGDQNAICENGICVSKIREAEISSFD